MLYIFLFPQYFPKIEIRLRFQIDSFQKFTKKDFGFCSDLLCQRKVGIWLPDFINMPMIFGFGFSQKLFYPFGNYILSDGNEQIRSVFSFIFIIKTKDVTIDMGKEFLIIQVGVGFG